VKWHGFLCEFAGVSYSTVTKDVLSQILDCIVKISVEFLPTLVDSLEQTCDSKQLALYLSNIKKT
jgi:hypothetical protein